MSLAKPDLNKITEVLVARILQQASVRPTFKAVLGIKNNFGGMEWKRSELVYTKGTLKPSDVLLSLKGLRVVKKLGVTKRNKFRTHEGHYVFSPDRKTDIDGILITVWRANCGDIQFLLAPIPQKTQAEIEAEETAKAEAEVEAALGKPKPKAKATSHPTAKKGKK